MAKSKENKNMTKTTKNWNKLVLRLHHGLKTKQVTTLMLEGLVFLDIPPFKTRMSVLYVFPSFKRGGGGGEGLCGGAGLHSRLLKIKGKHI